MREHGDGGVVRLCAAGFGGWLLVFAFPDYGLWWLAIPATMIILGSWRGASVRVAAGLGAVAGAMFYLPHIAWSKLFLGPIPWLALAGVMTLWWALFAAIAAAAYRTLGIASRPSDTGVGVLHASHPTASPLRTSAVIAGVWTLREWCSSTVPYGGFAWGRLAQSQSDSPFLQSVSWLGTSGLSFALVLISAYALEVVARARIRPSTAHRQRGYYATKLQPAPQARHPVVPLLGIGVMITALAAVPAWSTMTEGNTVGTRTVLAAQGNSPGASYFVPSDRGQVIREHLDVTNSALETAGNARVDLILWPEGSVDMSPLLYESVAADLNDLEQRAGAPVLFNTVTWEGELAPETDTFNSQVLWQHGGFAGQYDKVRPIPFGEYVPNREFYELLVPDLIGMIQREYTPGQRSNVLVIDDARYGVFICFDIVDDRLARAAVNDGAELLLAPTNNADFGFTHEAAQQLAFARMRAVETGRALVQVSTVGKSAAYNPDGSVVEQLEWYTPSAMLVELPLRQGVTPAVKLGAAIEIVASALALLVALPNRPRRRARHRLAGKQWAAVSM